jgi:DNA-directed RNA polymerase specialized sigma24 family protein
MPVDHFPSTHATWIDAQLTIAEDGGRARATGARDALRRHVMERYADALRAYVRGSSLRELAEADDLVHGFFADALEGPDFLREWRAHGGPLRRWMTNGLLFHARGLRRDRGRSREHGVGDSAALEAMAPHAEPVAEREFERAWANAFLRSACDRVRSALQAGGDDRPFDVFVRHVIDGRTYAEIADELGIAPNRCARMARDVTDLVRAEATRMLAEEGIRGEDAAAELRRIEAVLSE